jgi:hypothetical protein
MAAVDVTGPGAGVALTKDIYVNNSLVGPFDATSDVEVFLEDTGGNPITPVSSVLVGNDLTITANIPVPSGVALQFPTSSQYTSYVTGDIGWRTQNGWFDYVPPAYPAKFAELDMTAGANSWYKLKTALTVGGVTSTERFVDINGVQGWGLVGNANAAVIDKLTGLMFTRDLTKWGQGNYTTQNTNALGYSVVINGITYDEWYLMSLREYISIFGMLLTPGVWNDPISGLTITGTLANSGLSAGMWLSDAVGDNGGANKVQTYIQLAVASITNGFQGDLRHAVRVHKAYNLIS